MGHMIIVKNIHVYLVHPYYYIVPAIEDGSNGTWVEIQPVSKVDVMDLDNLAYSIEQANKFVSRTSNHKRWNGENKRIWTEATSYWAIHWYEDSTIDITPHFKLPSEIDDETGEMIDGGWAASQERGKSIFSSETPFSQLAKTILLSP